MNNTLSFNNKSHLRILQVSDPQDLKYVRPAMVQMLNAAYDKFSPDLVIFTGDNILGNHLLDRRLGTGHFAEGRDACFESMIEALGYVLEPVDRRNIPFAMIYGNHDDMNPISKDEQMGIYRSYKNCMVGNTDNKDVDCDTYVITLTQGGRVMWALYMIDSARQDKDGEHKCHEEITPETVKWFKETSEALKKDNGGRPVPSMVFVHIPLRAQMELCREVTPNTPGALQSDDGRYYKLDPVIARGIMREPISAVSTDNGFFDACLEAGGVKAIVTGHDHCNCFEGTYKGIRFIQTGCASFRCYGSPETRGVRVIDLDDKGGYKTVFYNYYDICGTSPARRLKYFMNADECEVKKFTIFGSAALAGLTALTAAVIRKILKK